MLDVFISKVKGCFTILGFAYNVTIAKKCCYVAVKAVNNKLVVMGYCE